MSSWHEEYKKGYKDGVEAKENADFLKYCMAHKLKIITYEAAEDIKEKMCDEYCRYPIMPIPKGKTEDWLVEDPESPCNICPLSVL